MLITHSKIGESVIKMRYDNNVGFH